jgi:hypothetical protein
VSRVRTPPNKELKLTKHEHNGASQLNSGVRPRQANRLPLMNKSFTPSFQHFQNDVEGYLKSEGKCEKNEHRQTVYRGYPAALAQMFRTYVEKEAFTPLAAELRKWNWEWGYNDYLLELSSGLQHNKTRNLLLESLYRLQQYASELGHEADVKEYVAMTVRVEKRLKA